MNEQLLHEKLNKYHYYHVIQVTDGVRTPGWTDPRVLQIQETALKALRTLPLEGKRVLDVGCRDGLFSFEAEKLGATEIIGIDNDLSRGATEVLIPFFNSRVKMQELNLYDLTPTTFGLFDVVLCAGVLYHLRYPFWGLKVIRDVLKAGGYLLLETAIFVDENDYAMLFCPTGKDSPYEPTSCTFYNTKGLIDTLTSLDFTVGGVSYCLSEHLERLGQWQRLKRRVRGFLDLKRRMVLDRATVICQRPAANDDANPKVNKYWHGIHHTHSNADYSW